MFPPVGPMFMMWRLGPTFVSHIVDKGATVPPAGHTLVTWHHGSTVGPTTMRWGVVPPTGPTGVTWHHGGTCWSHVVDVAS